MSAIKRALASRWFLSLLGCLLIAVLIWFIGPMFGYGGSYPLETTRSRIITGVFVLLVWAVWQLVGMFRRKLTNERLTKEIAGGGKAAEGSEDRESELPILRQRMQDALQQLRRARLGGKGGRRYLYQLPWYMLIGPPGSGKTTALKHSGLKFPVAEQGGRESVKGVGGTRNCDWWFTDEAVLIDTAGRYTTQDSHQAADAQAWSGFLNLLKRNRPRQPINGAIVAISLADIALGDESERANHALAIRKRLGELAGAFGVRVPIYVVLTKADLMAGFVEFFDDLGREDREQVWGMTFPLERGRESGDVVDSFGAEFDLLIDRLNTRMIERLHQEPDIARRSLVWGFPAQIASLKEPLREFLDAVFRPNRYEQRPFLRGIYLTSGTQEGTPIDRLMGAMASSFGLDRQTLPAFSGRGRSYFLTRLLRQVMFAEAGVVGVDRRVERRQRWIRRVAYAVLILGVLGMGAAWTNAYLENKALVASVQAAEADYNSKVAGLAGTAVQTSDYSQILPPLDALRAMPTGFAARGQDVPRTMTLGLYQGDKLGSQAVTAYRRALNQLLLPRLVVRLEEQMRANMQYPEFLYEGLRVYLMLGGQGPLDPTAIQGWFGLDWAALFPGLPGEPTRNALTGHLQGLLEQPLLSVALDGDLVMGVRRVLQQMTPAERAYARLQQSPEARALPEWTIADHAGPAGSRVLERQSGRMLTEGIPGIFTYDGFHYVVLPSLARVVGDVVEENWIVADATTTPDNAALARDLLQIYYNDYAVRWETLLGDLRIRPLGSLPTAVETLNSLAGPASPIVNLLRSVVRETKLTVPPPEPTAPAEAAAGAAGVTLPAGVQVPGAAAAGQAAARLGPLAQIFANAGQPIGAAAGAGAGPLEGVPGQFIDDRFRRLHELVEAGAGGQAALDTVVRSLDALYLQLNSMALAPNQTGPALNPEVTRLAQELTATATRVPQPLSGWLQAIAQGSTTITVGGARDRLNADWNVQVLPLCKRALDDRYPIFAGSRADATMDDFTRLFGPNGLIDAYFNNTLRPFVDTAAPEWRWTRVNNVDLGIPDAVLAHFQKAATIRDSFFPAGAGAPNVTFEVVPLSLSPTAAQVVLEINGQTISYAHGPTRPLRMQWPGPGANQVRVSFTPVGGGQTAAISRDGPWAFFRLLDASGVQRSSLSDRFNVTFSAGGHSATFEVRASSVLNPFALPALGQFRCPGPF